MTAATDIPTRDAPALADLAAAANAVRETCDLQLGLALRTRPDDEGAAVAAVAADWCRSSISLTTAGGCWRLTMVVDALSARRLAQRLYALDPDEDPAHAELSDALKEMVNIAAGVFKRDRCGEALRITLPVFAVGWPGQAPPAGVQDSIRLTAGTSDPQIHVLLRWRREDEPGDDRDES